VKESNQTVYYTGSNMLHETANQPVPGVYYGFHRDRFFAVFIKLRSPDQYSHLEQQFRRKYGEPKTTRNTAGSLTENRWEDADVIIKLKARESPVEFKLAMYCLPPAAELDQDQLEDETPDAGDMSSAANDSAFKRSPLIGY
jgi:hypothetical protein